jgi:cell division control protein 6
LKIKEELEEEVDDIFVFYINLWKKNTQYKIILELCAQLDYKFIQNKSADELFQIIKSKINQKSAVFILDEIDKAESLEILYSLMEDIYKKTLILITNDHSFIYKLDPRLKSRLLPDNLEFKPYSQTEVENILKNRIELAFHSGVFPKENLNLIATKTYNSSDIRKGLFLLRESGLIAESLSLKQISLDHITKALSKLDDSTQPLELDTDEKKILKAITSNPDKTTQEIFSLYQKEGNKSERTFQRKLKTLEKANLIKLESVAGQGRSYKIQLLNSKDTP